MNFKDIADDIDQHIAMFQTQISSRIDILQSTITDKISNVNDAVKEVRDKAEELRENQEMVRNQNKPRPTNANSNEFSIDDYLMAGSYSGAVALLACYYAKETNKKINFNELTDAFSGTTIEYNYGYIISSVAARVITINGYFPEFFVSDVMVGLKVACLKMIKAFIPTVPEISEEEFLKKLNIITSYFSVAPITKEDLSKS